MWPVEADRAQLNGLDAREPEQPVWVLGVMRSDLSEEVPGGTLRTNGLAPRADGPAPPARPSLPLAPSPRSCSPTAAVDLSLDLSWAIRPLGEGCTVRRQRGLPAAVRPCQDRRMRAHLLLEAIRPNVDAGDVPDAVVGVLHDGQVSVEAAGTIAHSEHTPLAGDALMRIAPNTKPMAAVVALSLAEAVVLARSRDGDASATDREGDQTPHRCARAPGANLGPLGTREGMKAARPRDGCGESSGNSAGNGRPTWSPWRTAATTAPSRSPNASFGRSTLYPPPSSVNASKRELDSRRRRSAETSSRRRPSRFRHPAGRRRLTCPAWLWCPVGFGSRTLLTRTSNVP